MKREIKRNKKGRFEKGSTGNPLGRPIRPTLRNTPDELREQFFKLANSRVTISEGGRKRSVTISEAITMKWIKLALNDNRVAIVQYKRLEERYAAERLAETLVLWEQVLSGEKTVRDFPDDVTDHHIDLVRQARARLRSYGYP